MLPQLVLVGALRSEPLSAERAPPIYNTDSMVNRLHAHNIITNIIIYKHVQTVKTLPLSVAISSNITDA